MNINEIKEKIAELTNESKEIRLPYHMIEEAIRVVKDKANLDLGIINYTDIHFFTVISAVETLLNHLGLEYDFPKTDDGLINSYQVYEEFYDIYDSETYKTFYMFDELLGKEVRLAERAYLQTGTTEGRMVSIMEKMAKNINDFSDVINDDKKLEKKLKIVKKHIPQLGSVFGEIGKYLPRLTEMLERRMGSVDKDKIEEGINEVGIEK